MFVFCSSQVILPRLHPADSCCDSNFVLLQYLLLNKSIMEVLNASLSLLMPSENYRGLFMSLLSCKRETKSVQRNRRVKNLV